MARPFSFADVRQSGSFCGVPRPILRYSLMACLLAATVFGAWSWFRPYAWEPEAAARGEILETLVTRDQSFFWVNVHLKVTPGLTHDLQKNVYLMRAIHPLKKDFLPHLSTLVVILLLSSCEKESDNLISLEKFIR